MFFIFAFLFYGVKLTYRLVGKKSVKIQLINVFLWIVVVSLIGYRHVILASDTERAASEVSKGIEKYYSTKGEYPISLNQIGVSNVANEYRITYGIRNGTPLLVYPVTWKYFGAYTDNFEKKVWKYQA